MVNLLLLFFFTTYFTKTKPAGRVPPDAILLSGNKSMQKCLLLAEGIFFCQFPDPSTYCGCGIPALCIGGPNGRVSSWGWHNQQMVFDLSLS